MNIFDKEFFPTPKETVIKMVTPYIDILPTATILEPSAGNGAILDTITKIGLDKTITNARGDIRHIDITANPRHVYAIEKNLELTMILQQKDYKVIAQDFLSFQPEHHFDLILMNPPFSNGDDHLLHAWEILRGGEIACLLNAETIRNPYTAARKRLSKIIKQNGSVEYIGQAFKTADNPTDVEVALVRLHKEPKEDPFNLNIGGFTKEKMPDFGEMARQGDTVAVRNGLDAYLRSWQYAKLAAQDLITSYGRFLFFASVFLDKEQKGDRGRNVTDHLLKTLSELRYNTSDNLKDVYNDFIDTAKQNAWNVIFEQIGLGKYMTSGLRQKLIEFRDTQGSMELTKENINALFNYIMFNISDIMNQTVVEVYDMFTRYFKGNTEHNEGWKTNKRFRCNRKVILPNTVSAGFKPEIYGYDPYYSVDSYGRLEDIDKAMCWLTGSDYDNLVTQQAYDRGRLRESSSSRHSIAATIPTIPVGSTDWHDSAFFRVKAFKKGTIHLEFKDEDVWNRFNIAVNEGKNQLGMAE